MDIFLTKKNIVNKYTRNRKQFGKNTVGALKKLSRPGQVLGKSLTKAELELTKILIKVLER